jgi:hypothetical protein
LQSQKKVGIIRIAQQWVREDVELGHLAISEPLVPEPMFVNEAIV